MTDNTGRMRAERIDDLTLQSILVTAVPETATAPLVVVMHGRGADAADLADLAPYLDQGYRFVFPNAPRPFEYDGMAFGLTWFDGLPPTGPTFAESRELLLRLYRELLERYPTPPGKLAVAGFSQGGVMALDTGYRFEGVAAIVCMSGAINENDLPPIDAHAGIPLLVVHGTEDEMIAIVNARKTRRILEDHGAHPEYHEFAMGHAVTPESIAVVRDFLGRTLA